MTCLNGKILFCFMIFFLLGSNINSIDQKILLENDPGEVQKLNLDISITKFKKIKTRITNTHDPISIDGLIYATDELKLDAFQTDLALTGGIIAGNFKVNSLWQPLIINYNEPVIIRTLGQPLSAPVINIEHWEEEY